MANKITIADVQGLIALAILNNKIGVIDAMNASGYPVASNISDSDLFKAVGEVGDKYGIEKLKSVLANVDFDSSKFTADELRSLIAKFNIATPDPSTASKSDWFNKAITKFGDFFLGSTVINTNPVQQTSEPALPAWVVILISIIGIISIVIIQRGQAKGKTAISIVIGVVVLAVVAYGIFAKKISISGGGASQTVHTGALVYVKSLLGFFGI